MSRSRLSWPVPLAALALLVAGCSASVSVGGLDVGAVEEQIEQGIEEQTGVVAVVQCPGDVEVKVGSTFSCTATFEDGSTQAILVTPDEEDQLAWELQAPPGVAGSELDMAKIEKSITDGIAEQLELTVTVECPESVTQEAGSTFDCIATAEDGSTATVLVSQTDDEGNVTWELQN